MQFRQTDIDHVVPDFVGVRYLTRDLTGNLFFEVSLKNICFLPKLGQSGKKRFTRRGPEVAVLLPMRKVRGVLGR